MTTSRCGIELAKVIRVGGDDLLAATPGADHEVGVGDVAVSTGGEQWTMLVAAPFSTLQQSAASVLRLGVEAVARLPRRVREAATVGDRKRPWHHVARD